MVVSIDLGDLTGKGLSTGNVYVTGGLISLTRRLVPGDVIQATVPFFVRGASPDAKTDLFSRAAARFYRIPLGG